MFISIYIYTSQIRALSECTFPSVLFQEPELRVTPSAPPKRRTSHNTIRIHPYLSSFPPAYLLFIPLIHTSHSRLTLCNLLNARNPVCAVNPSLGSIAGPGAARQVRRQARARRQLLFPSRRGGALIIYRYR